MKFALTSAILALLFLSCEKKETSPPVTTPDPMESTDRTSAAPISSDTIRASDSTSRSGDSVRTVQ